MTDRSLHRALAAALVVTLALAGAAGAQGRTYRWVDPQGNVTYSDRPQPAPPPAPAATGREGQVDEILELSGLKRQVQRMPAEIQMRLQQQRAQSPRPETHDRVAQAFARAFTEDALAARMRAVMVARFDPVQAEAFVTWLRGPVSRRLNEVEAAAESPAGQQELARYAQTLQKVPPPPDRAALARRVVEATSVVDVTLDVLFAMARVSARAVDAAQPPEKRLKPGQLDAQIRAAREKAYEPLRVSAVISVLYTYRALPAEDLDAYATFYATPPARWFIASIRHALVETITALTEQAMTEAAPSIVAPAPK
jgi:hypothetical protein